MIIYGVIGKDEKLYVGKTSDYKRRMYHHKYYLKKGKHDNRLMQLEYDSGFTNFETIKLIELPKGIPDKIATAIEKVITEQVILAGKSYNLKAGNDKTLYTKEQRDNIKKGANSRSYQTTTLVTGPNGEYTGLYAASRANRMSLYTLKKLLCDPNSGWSSIRIKKLNS